MRRIGCFHSDVDFGVATHLDMVGEELAEGLVLAIELERLRGADAAEVGGG